MRTIDSENVHKPQGLMGVLSTFINVKKWKCVLVNSAGINVDGTMLTAINVLIIRFHLSMSLSFHAQKVAIFLTNHLEVKIVG